MVGSGMPLVIFVTWLNVAAAAPAAIKKVTVTEATLNTRIPVALAGKVATTIRFSKAINPQTLTVGNADDYALEVVSPAQISAKSLARKVGDSTNLNVLTTDGVPLVLLLQTTSNDRADTFVDITVDVVGKQTATAFCRPEVEQATEQAKRDQDAAFLSGVADVGSYRSIDQRAINDGVIVKVADMFKLGSRGYLRFTVQNRSSSAWTFASVELELLVGDKVVQSIEHTLALTPRTIAVGAEVHAAISFLLYDVPSKAKLRMSVRESAGTRHVGGILFAP